MDYFIDFTAAEFGDGTAHTHAASEGAPGCWNAVTGRETEIINALSSGDKVWIRRVGTGVSGNAMLLQYYDGKVAWIGWPESGDEYYDTRPGTGGPSPDPRTDWDPDTLTYDYADIALLTYGSNQRFHRINVTGDAYGDWGQFRADFENCRFEGTLELLGDPPGQTPYQNTFRHCDFYGPVEVTGARDLLFNFCSFQRDDGGANKSLSIKWSYGVYVYGCYSPSGADPFWISESGAIELTASDLPGIEFDRCSMIKMANVGIVGTHAYGVNLVNCTGPVSLDDSWLNGSTADLRVDWERGGVHSAGIVNCRHLELSHETVHFDPVSGGFLPDSFPMLNMSEYNGDPTAYKSWQWGGQITADTTIYRHGSYPISYKLEPNTFGPNWCPRLVVNMWGLEVTYVDQEPSSFGFFAIHGLHEGWSSATLNQRTLWAETDSGDASGFGLQGKRFTFATRSVLNPAWEITPLEDDLTSTWENQGSLTPFVLYAPLPAIHTDPVNLRVPIRLILAAFSGAKVIYIDPIPRMAG